MKKLHSLILVFASLLSACGANDGKSGEVWKEEVRLQNGNLIVVDREFRWGESGDLSQRKGPLTYASMKFEYEGKLYEWEANGLWPMIIQIDGSGILTVVSRIPYCSVWLRRGKPSDQYVVEKSYDSGWKKVTLEEMDVNPKSNLSSHHSGKPYLREMEDRIIDQRQSTEEVKSVVLSKRKMGC